MLSCKEITQLASDSLEKKKLSFRKRMELKMHLMMCGLCSRFVRSMRKIHSETRACVNDVEAGKIDNVKISELSRQKIDAMLRRSKD